MDLNTLISTIVTSTAALVAIIGGFLISRVITLSSEQTGVKRKLNEIKNDIFAKGEMLKKIEQDLLDEDAEDFIDYNYTDLLFNEKSFEEIVGIEGFRNRSSEDLQPYIDELYLVKSELEKVVAEAAVIHNDYDEFMRIYKPQLSHRKDWYELIYSHLIYELKRQRRKQEQKRGELGGVISRLDIDLIPPSSVNLLSRNFHINNQENIRAYREKKRDRNRLKDELTVLRIQKEDQKKILLDYGKPKGLWWGLAVLFYACLVGIAYPSTLLPYPVAFYDDESTKLLLLGLFF